MFFITFAMHASDVREYTEAEAVSRKRIPSFFLLSFQFLSLSSPKNDAEEYYKIKNIIANFIIV